MLSGVTNIDFALYFISVFFSRDNLFSLRKLCQDYIRIWAGPINFEQFNVPEHLKTLEISWKILDLRKSGIILAFS